MARIKKNFWGKLIIVICCVICGIIFLTSNSNNVFADDPSGSSDPCYDSGIDSMAWIICPIVNNTTTTVDGIEKILRSWLTIKPNEVFIDGTYQGWEVFRNFANAILIIIFLFVIFSQLTGVGIDNYGIKKLLPKLITMAVLINLSYIICEIAVDLSNILGVGLNELFKYIGENIAATTKVAFGEVTIAGIVAGILGTLAGAGAIAGTAISIAAVASGGGAMLVISLILVLIVALVSVLMFFVMLGARMMIVIIFTIIAPVAFAFYILPNTQSLFKKWWKVFQAALVVFPICGALYGAKYIIQAIVFAQNDDADFVLPLIGLCAPFLPFLLLPSLLKSALAGLGALGGTITALGNGIKKGVGKGNDAIKNTDRYKNAQARNLERRIHRRAAIGADGKPLDMSKHKFRRFLYGGDSGIAQARVQDIKNQEARAREADMMGSGYDALLAGSEAKIDAQRVADEVARMKNGRVDGVNVNDLKSVQAHHARALLAFQNATTEQGRSEAMTQIKAAQSILSGTDKGRGYVQENFEGAVNGGYADSLQEASSHLLGEYGDTYKSKNRGAHEMLQDLAQNTSMATIAGKISNGEYNTFGSGKYTAESLAGADDAAIDGFVDAINNGTMSGDDLTNIQSTAYEALAKQKAGTLNIKPEVVKKLEEISAGYVPPATSNSQAKIISHGAYEDSNGNVYHLRQMDNGKYLDDSGFEVDITHFKQR